MIKKILGLMIIIANTTTLSAANDTVVIPWNKRWDSSKDAVAWTNFVTGFHNCIRQEDFIPPADVEHRKFFKCQGYRVARAILDAGVDREFLLTFTPLIFTGYKSWRIRAFDRQFNEECIKAAHVIMKEQLEIEN